MGAQRAIAGYAVCLTIVVLATLAYSVGDVYAASITVDKTADDDTNGSCTLWDAITAANTDTATNGCPAGSGADTITLGVNITLAAELPEITTEITVEGAEYDIDGNGEHRIFAINGGNLTINNITLTGGDAGNYGGAINAEDGSTLTVTNTRLEGNEAGLLGGAIATSNTNVVIKNSVFVDNYSGSLGGALSFFSNEPGDFGWTDQDEVKTLLIDQTTFGEDVPEGCAAADISNDPENEAASSGGAVDISGGNATIRRSSFIGNKAGTDGGAIYASPWRFLFENNTVSCNAADADGGGMHVIIGDLILRHSTIYQNTAGDEGGGLYSIDDSQGYPDADTITWGLYLQNSIIAGSKGGGDCVAHDEIDHSVGMYIGDGSCEPACSAQNGPINLGPLQGEPAYHPLLDGSVAINRADVEVCSIPEATDTPSSQTARSQQAQDFSDTNICEELDPDQDQIGTGRPMYGNCDIGAIESRTGVVLPDEDLTGQEDPPDSVTPTATNTVVPDAPDNDTPTATNTVVPGAADNDTPTATNTDVPDPADTETPTATNTDVPDPADTETPTATNTDVPDPADTDTPTATNTDVPDPADTDTPTATNTLPPDTVASDTPTATNTLPPDTVASDTPTATNTAPATATIDPNLPLETAIVLTQTAEKATHDSSLTQTQVVSVTETEVAKLPPVEQTAFASTATQVAILLTPTEVEDSPPVEQTAVVLTATEIAKLPPVEQTATAQTGTAIANLPPEEQTAIAQTQVAGDPESRCTHTVEVGETLFYLAQFYNTTVEDFRRINQLTEDALVVGLELIVPDCYVPDGDLESSTLGFSCQNLYDSMVVRTASEVVGCREVDIELIDKHPALASGMIAAIDIFGYVESGVEVCFRNIGELVFLDRASEPPAPRSLPSFNNAVGMTCGEIEDVGTLVLVAAVIERDTFVELSSCRVTTTQTLRLRDEIGSATVLRLVPYNVTLDTYSRTNNWFNVTFLDSQGWISASYVRTDGICE